jgi:hypothetical protein
VSSKETRQVRPGLLIVLAVMVGLMLVYAVWTFVASPLLAGNAEEIGAEPVAAPEPVPEPEPTPEPEPEPIPETIEVFSARDPFQQLVRGSGAGGTAAAAGSDTTPLAATTTDGQAQAPSPTEAPTVAGATPGAPAGAQVGATSIRLIDVFTDDGGQEKVLVQVNGTGYEVGEGDTFAQRFRVLDISGRCATFLFGDNRFTLCRGEEIRK